MQVVTSAHDAVDELDPGSETESDAPAADAPARSAASGPDRGPTTADTSAARSLHHLTVVTPEGVVLDFRAAGIASRTLAKAIDLLIQFIGLLAAIFLAAFLSFVSEALAVVAIVVLLFGIFYGYPALLETFWDGHTVGKRLFGIRVITIEGGPVRFRHAAIRSLIGTFDFWFPTPGGLIAVSFVLLTKRSQRLGDLAAGTIVIREPRASQAPVFFAPAQGAEGVSRNLDTSRLDAHHYTLVREFLLRAGELMPDARWELGELLADRVAAYTGNPRPPGLDGERFLVSVLHAHQARFDDGSLAPPPPPPTAPPAVWQPPPGPPVHVDGGRQPVDLSRLPPPTGPPVQPRG
ncbi:MAG: RDD family protein [Acidimicrobiia bacterium]|nr:RDD family protein [Acidimicrobiia bacterium]